MPAISIATSLSPQTLAERLTSACARRLLLLLLTLPAVVQAQFTYTTNNGQITITRYTGPGGAVVIPTTINGRPVTPYGQKKLMRPLGNNISRGRRGVRDSECPLPFHRSDPRALETGSPCPCLGDFAPRGSDSRNSQGRGVGEHC